MAAVVPILASLGAGAAASTLSVIGTGISLVSGIAGIASTIQSSKFEAKVLEQQAQIAEDNRQRSVQEGALAAQRADEAASQELGLLLAEQSATGLSGGSYALQRKSLQELAARDRGTIVYDAEVRGSRYAQQAQDARVQSRQTKTAGRFNAFGGLLATGGSLVSGAAKFRTLRSKELSY